MITVSSFLITEGKSAKQLALDLCLLSYKIGTLVKVPIVLSASAIISSNRLGESVHLNQSQKVI